MLAMLAMLAVLAFANRYPLRQAVTLPVSSASIHSWIGIDIGIVPKMPVENSCLIGKSSMDEAFYVCSYGY